MRFVKLIGNAVDTWVQIWHYLCMDKDKYGMEELPRNLSNFVKDRKIFIGVKNDPEQRKIVIGYGIASCLWAVAAFLVGYLSFVGADALINSNASIYITWISIPLYIVAFVFPLYAFTEGIIGAVRQIQLDKKLFGIMGAVLNPVAITAAYYLILTNII